MASTASIASESSTARECRVALRPRQSEWLIGPVDDLEHDVNGTR